LEYGTVVLQWHFTVFYHFIDLPDPPLYTIPVETGRTISPGMAPAEMGTYPRPFDAFGMNMDRKIEHRPISLRSISDSMDWDIGRLCYRLIIILFLVFSLANMFFYGLYVWRFTNEFRPQYHQQAVNGNP
jgi:hypothetical protein